MVHEEKSNDIISEISHSFNKLSFGAKFSLLIPVLFILVISLTVNMGLSRSTNYDNSARAQTEAYPVISSDASLTVLMLNPTSMNVKKDSVFTVALRLDTHGQKINATEIAMAYSPTLLEARQVTLNNDVFDVQVSNTFGGGNIQIIAGSSKPKVGTYTIATISFRAKGTGQARVSFTAPTTILSYDTNKNILYSMTGGKYFIK